MRESWKRKRDELDVPGTPPIYRISPLLAGKSFVAIMTTPQVGACQSVIAGASISGHHVGSGVARESSSLRGSKTGGCTG